MTTAKYVLKSDRTKTIDVISPVFSIATIVDAKGGKTEMKRDEFDQLYEPVLPKPNLAGVDFAVPTVRDPALTRIEDSLVALHAKLDAISKIVVPPADATKPD